MSLKEHAQRELEAAGLFNKEEVYNGMLGMAVLELIEVFAKQGHSGMSAGLVLDIFNKVAKYECLTPIKGTPEEFVEVVEGLYQNKRLSSIFKEEGGGVYYTDAIVFKTQRGFTYSGRTKEGISSAQYIKSFPFTPKTFTIDVIEKEVAKEDWEFEIKDWSQIDEVKAYYNFIEPIAKEVPK